MAPVLIVNGKMIKMIQVGEFIERLQSAHRDKQLNFKASDNENEQEQYDELKSLIEKDIKEKKQYQPSYWDYINEVYGEKEEEPVKNEFESEEES